MNITNIKIRRTYEDNRLRALVSLTLEGDFAVHDIKVIEGSERLFVAMPSRRDEQGSFRDICHHRGGKADDGRQNSRRLSGTSGGSVPPPT